jgi:hypothetical protein
MGGVPMPVVQVVHVAVMRHRHMATALAVLVLMCAVNLMAGLTTLVHVVGMSPVDVAVVGVVGVVLVREGDMTAALAVLVRVVGVGAVVRMVGVGAVVHGGGHLRLLVQALFGRSQISFLCHINIWQFMHIRW